MNIPGGLKGLALGAAPLLGLGAYGGYRYYDAVNNPSLMESAWTGLKNNYPAAIGAGALGALGGYGLGRYYNGLGSRISGTPMERLRGFTAPHLFRGMEQEVENLRNEYAQKMELLGGSGLGDIPSEALKFDIPDLHNTDNIDPLNLVIKEKTASLSISLVRRAVLNEIFDKKAAINPNVYKGLAAGLGLTALGTGAYSLASPALADMQAKADRNAKIRKYLAYSAPIGLALGVGAGAGYLGGRSAGRSQLDDSMQLMRDQMTYSAQNDYFDRDLANTVSALKQNGALGGQYVGQ
jgi:hypothetical protein